MQRLLLCTLRERLAVLQAPAGGFCCAASWRPEGKTSLTHQFVEGKFLEDYDPTVVASGARGEQSSSLTGEVRAVEGKKLAESCGATFMESSAIENQVLSLKIRKLTQGIFTKVIQEIARVKNSYGHKRHCCFL